MSAAGASFLKKRRIRWQRQHIIFLRMSAARASLFEIIVAGRTVQHAHVRRMSQAKRLFLQKPMLAISQFGEDVPSEIAIFARLEDALGVILGLVLGSFGPSRCPQKSLQLNVRHICFLRMSLAKSSFLEAGSGRIEAFSRAILRRC